MSGLWIRVAADIRDRKVVWRLAVSAGLPADSAVGFLVMLWGAVAKHCEGGDIREIPDEQLESWVGWRGEAGWFSRWVREHHATDGVINEWEEYAGALEVRRAADRKRKSAARSHGQSAGHPQDIRTHSSRNENENVNDTQTVSPRAKPKVVVDEAAPADWYHGLTTPERAVLQEFIRRRPASVSPEKLFSLLEGWRAGLGMDGGKAPSWSQIIAGLADYNASEHTDYTPRHIRSFVAREMRGDKPQGQHGNGNGARKSAGQQAYDNARKALEE